MATGLVSSINYDNWQLIATNTPTSGTSSTISGISGYKKLMVVVKNITMSGGSAWYNLIRFNSDSNTNYVSTVNAGGSTKYYNYGIALDVYDTAAGVRSAVVTIDNVLGIGAKPVSGTGGNTDNGFAMVQGAWISDSAITSITLVASAGSNTFTSNTGTFSVYGIAA